MENDAESLTEMESVMEVVREVAALVDSDEVAFEYVLEAV